MLLRDLVGLPWHDALLGALACARSAADAGACDLEALETRGCAAEREALAKDGGDAQVEELDPAVVDAEGVEDIAGRAGIHIIHRGVLLEDAVDPGVGIVLDALGRAGEADHLPILRHPHDCDMGIVHELGIEVLAAASAEIELPFLDEHHVDGAVLGLSGLIDRGEGDILDVPQHLKTCLCIHGAILSLCASLDL